MQFWEDSLFKYVQQVCARCSPISASVRDAPYGDHSLEA